LDGWRVWLQFVVIVGVIGFSGTRLSRYADALAEKTGLGRTWIGLVGLAIVTSLPELVTGATAVLWINAPDIAVGNLLGACMLNVAILAVADLLYAPGPVLTAADRGHILAGGFGVIMLGVATLGVMARPPLAHFSLGYVGLSAPVLIFCYLLAMRATYRYQKRQRAEFLKDHEEVLLYPYLTLPQAAWRFGLNALIVMGAAFWLPQVATRLAQIMNWHLSMVGTVFVAVATTMPELVVTISAIRLQAVDLAVGDLLGSLLINVAMLGLMDLLYAAGPLLQAVGPENANTGVIVMVMVGIAIAEMIYRPQQKALRWVSLGAFLLAFMYAVNIFVQMLAA
jgi:cation:H+ antiporter